MEWYKEVLGFTVVKERVEFVADDSLLGMAAKDMHGPSLKKMRTVLLSSAIQVGFEIFEYVIHRKKDVWITVNIGNQVFSTFA
jgi:hypothetical protein